MAGTCASCGAALADAVRFCSQCGTPVEQAAPVAETRKTVTVLFCDVVGSTALGEQRDPEAMRAVMTRYFERMQQVLESHGGSVEKFIGDAVMAVFGVPTVHEDDALRAVRAAAEMQDALVTLNDELSLTYGVQLATRIGVNTGEVVAGSGPRGTVATGDAVNLAARLEQAAEAGEILLGDVTYRLVRAAVDVEPCPPLPVKGKAEPVPAWRLLRVNADRDRATDVAAPLVGRDREQRLLIEAFERSRDERICQLFTLLGVAGAGKSRLAEDFLARVGPTATVLRGRCLSYGEGISFWALTEILRAAVGVDADEHGAVGRSRLADLLADDPEASRVVERLAPLAGFGGEPAGVEETQWAARRWLQAISRDRPTVLVVEDVHWAENSMLDLLEHLAVFTRDVPVLILCLARPEFLDGRSWGGTLNATNVQLEPLAAAATEEMVTHLLGGGVRDALRQQIVGAAGGNPLFVEQLIAMLVDEQALIRDRAGAWSLVDPDQQLDVPPTIRALLAARLDRLSAVERSVLEAASVVGQVFYVGATAELVRDYSPGQVDNALLNLVRREFVRPDRSDIVGEEAYRFLHVLIRDAAYAGLPKAERATMHERLARWLDKRDPQAAGPMDEFVGYHLEQAVRLRAELGPIDDATRQIGVEGSTRLAAAADRVRPADTRSAAGLFARAAWLVSHDPTRTARLCLARARSLEHAGLIEEAADAAAEAAGAAGSAGDDALAVTAALAVAYFASIREPGTAYDKGRHLVDAALRDYADPPNPEVLAAAYHLQANLHNMRGQHAAQYDALRHGLRNAELAGDGVLASDLRHWVPWALWAGPVPADRCLAELAELSAGTDDRFLTATIRCAEGFFFALGDRPDAARAALAAAAEQFDDLKMANSSAYLGYFGGEALRVLGDIDGAIAHYQSGVDSLLELGAYAYLSTLALEYANLLADVGAREQAEHWLEVGLHYTSEEDLADQVLKRLARGRLLVAAGRPDEALPVLDECIDVVATTDIITRHAPALVVRAAALRDLGRDDEAQADLRRALELHRRKGNRPDAARVEEALSLLSTTA